MPKGKEEKRLKQHIVSLNDLVSPNHFVRKLRSVLDFSFIQDEVREHWDDENYPDIVPDFIVRHRLFCHLYKIPLGSQREQDLGSNMPYRWLCMYGLLDPMPSGETVKQIQERCGGMDLWDSFFDRILSQCQKNNLPYQYGGGYDYQE